MRSRDGAQDQENAPMSPDPFPLEKLGSGNETRSSVNLYTVHSVEKVSEQGETMAKS